MRPRTGFNRLGTLTYRGEGCHDPLRLRDDLALFFRELRSGLDAGRFPYVWVPQWHPGGHGLHAHFAVGRTSYPSLKLRRRLASVDEVGEQVEILRVEGQERNLMRVCRCGDDEIDRAAARFAAPTH